MKLSNKLDLTCYSGHMMSERMALGFNPGMPAGLSSQAMMGYLSSDGQGGPPDAYRPDTQASPPPMEPKIQLLSQLNG